MATYKIKTKRFLRKYSAAEKLPVSAALIDAQRVVDELCNVPWLEVAPTESVVTSHDESKLDENVRNRDLFDAALFCAEHANGEHRAFANAACYKIQFPTGTTANLTGLKVRVTSDAYNAHGARIALVTNSTGVIPTDCATCRGEGGVHAAGVAPQTIQTVDGRRYGYPTIADCVFSVPDDGTVPDAPRVAGAGNLPSGGLALGGYLYVFVLLENYNSVRGNWLEGSSCLKNLIELTTDAAVPGWTDGDTIDLTVQETARELIVLADGVLPDVSGDTSCVIADTVTAAGTSPVMVGYHVVDIDQVEDETAPANNYQGVRALYAHLATGEFKSGAFEICHPDRKRIGVGFNVRQGTSVVFADEAGNTCSARSLTLTSSALIVPFSLPSWTPVKVSFDWASWLSGRSPTSGVMFAFYLCPGKYLTQYDAEVIRSANMNRGRSDFGSWKLIGTSSVSSGYATLGVALAGADVGTFLIVAYMPQDSISTSTGSFSVGTSDFWYDSVTPDELLGGSLVSVYNLLSNYQVSNLARMNYNRNILTFSKSSSTGTVYDTIYANGVFVGDSESGIVYSEDGVNWSVSDMRQNCKFKFAFNGDKIVAVSARSGVSYSKAYYSTDGKVWTPASISEAETSFFSGCVVFGGKFYAYENGVGIFKSEDGTSWSKVYSTSSSTGAKGLFVCGDRMFLGGKFFTDNGNDFNTITSCPTFDVAVGAVKLGSDYFVFDDNGGYIYGRDSFGRVGGDEAATPIFLSVAAIGSTCVASMEDGGVYYSSNGHTWTKANDLGDTLIRDVFAVGSEFFAVGSGVHVSANGRDWTTLISGKSFSILAKSDSRFVVTGLNGVYYSDLRFGSVYECIANESAGSFSPSNWRFIGEPVVERLHGDDTLCVPDVKLIG